MDETDTAAPAVPTPAAVLARVPDPRGARGRRRPRPAPLLLLVAAVLGGADATRAWARWGRHAGWPALRRLGSTRAGGPGRATLNRPPRRVDVVALAAMLSTRLRHVRATWRRRAARWLDGIAIDGKTPRGASR
jgi:hypothetical protein